MMSRQLVLVPALLSLVALPLFASAAGLGGRGLLVGGLTSIQDTKDPHMVEIGKFAVSEYNKKSGENLTFVEVLKGAKQVVNGITYNLVLSATAGSSTAHYGAVVWEKAAPHSIQLQSFKSLSQ